MSWLCYNILQGWDFNPHFFVVYFGQYLKPKRAWIQVLFGAFLVVFLKLWITLIFIVFILLLFWSWDWMENSLRPLNLGVRKKKFFFLWFSWCISLQIMMNWMVSSTIARFNTQPTSWLSFIIYLMYLIHVQCRPINTKKNSQKTPKIFFLN